MRASIRLLLPASLLVAVAVTPLSAQDESTPEAERFRGSVEKIFGEALTRRNTYAMLTELCTRAPGRLAGTPAAAAAVEWGRQKMLELGFDNVRLEPCTVPHWHRGEIAELRYAAPAENAGHSLPILALGGSIGTPPAGVTAEVIEVKSFEELARRKDEARGRIVFFNRPMDSTLADPFQAYGGAVNQRTRGAVEGAKAGAVAVVVRSTTTRIDDVPHTGGTSYRDGIERIPAVAVSTRGAEEIAALLAAGKKVSLHLRLDCEWKEDKPSFNVVGELTGTIRPEELIIVGGHLDSWDVGPGAHDDGAGTCHSLEAVRLLKALDLKPSRTIRVVLFMNEENGLRGARAYYDAHKDEIDRVVLALESDRGGFAPRGFTTNANPEARARLQELASYLAPYGAGAVWQGGGGADISPLGKDGVILVGFRPDPQRYFNYHHTTIDSLEAVDERELELGSAAIASLLYLVSELEEPLPRNTVSESR